MFKVFKLHWLDGKIETIRGDNVQQAFMKAGIGNGAMRALDYWEEVKELPINERFIMIDGNIPGNQAFIDSLRKDLENGLKINFKAIVKYANREFVYIYYKDTGTVAMFRAEL